MEQETQEIWVTQAGQMPFDERKPYEELELADDFMFGKVMENKKLCKRTLEVLLDITIEDITYPELQKSINITYEGKNIRLDLYVEDEKETVYNGEMQRKKKTDAKSSNRKKGLPDIELPKRSRYYQSIIDLGLLEKGNSYQQLNNCYIIFICTFDPFGYGQYRYTFQNTCREMSGLLLGDETAKVFLNTKGTKGEISQDLKAFLHYIENSQPTDDFTEALHQEVEHVRQSTEWRREYMKEFLLKQEAFADGKEQGIQEGMEKGYFLTLFSLVSKGLLSEETAAAEANLTIPEFRKHAAELQG